MISKSFAASTALVAILAVAPAVNAHGFVKLAGVQGQQLSQAQKTNLGGSFFRAVPDNTGWIGSNFLTSAAITCGSSNTPFQTVASPDGTIFSASGQSAGKHLSIKSGQSVQLVISGNPGDGWPHPRGHVQTYLADCGDSCVGFDASKGKFFKIQSEVNGIQNTLKPAYDGSVDGNRYNVKIPAGVPNGKYIFRFELIAFGQSSNVEGNQDQYYPFCGQIEVTGASAATSKASLETVSFPGAYKNGNRDQNTVPGPSVLASGTTTVGGTTGKTGSTGSTSAGDSNTKGSTSTGTTPASSSSKLTLASGAPSCATMCLRVKISERAELAPNCAEDDGACMCALKDTFVQAFYNCARDNCDGGEEEADKFFDDACAAVEEDDEGDDDDECEEEDEEQVKRDIEAVQKKLAEIKKEKLRRRSTAAEGSIFEAYPIGLNKKATIPVAAAVTVERKRDEDLTPAELAKRYPAPPHPVIRPVVRSAEKRAPYKIVEDAAELQKREEREKREVKRLHGLTRAAHGKRFTREKRAKETAPVGVAK